MFYACLAIVWMTAKAGYRRGVFDGALNFAGLARLAGEKRRQQRSQASVGDAPGNSALNDEPLAPEKTKNKRLKSLDTFRG